MYSVQMQLSIKKVMYQQTEQPKAKMYSHMSNLIFLVNFFRSALALKDKKMINVWAE